MPTTPDVDPGGLEGRFEELRGTLAVRSESLAALIEALADEAEEFAALLEAVPNRPGAERRLALARREREIAAIGRRNADRLRALSDHTAFEHYPHLTDA